MTDATREHPKGGDASMTETIEELVSDLQAIVDDGDRHGRAAQHSTTIYTRRLIERAISALKVSRSERAMELEEAAKVADGLAREYEGWAKSHPEEDQYSDESRARVCRNIAHAIRALSPASDGDSSGAVAPPLPSKQMAETEPTDREVVGLADKLLADNRILRETGTLGRFGWAYYVAFARGCLRAQSRRTPPSSAGWQPISTAPKKYQRLLQSFGELQAAAQRVVDETDRIHDSEPWPIKYRAPYEAITALRQLLATHYGLRTPPAPSQEGASEGEGDTALSMTIRLSPTRTRS